MISTWNLACWIEAFKNHVSLKFLSVAILIIMIIIMNNSNNNISKHVVFAMQDT